MRKVSVSSRCPNLSQFPVALKSQKHSTAISNKRWKADATKRWVSSLGTQVYSADHSFSSGSHVPKSQFRSLIKMGHKVLISPSLRATTLQHLSPAPFLEDASAYEMYPHELPQAAPVSPLERALHFTLQLSQLERLGAICWIRGMKAEGRERAVIICMSLCTCGKQWI